MCVEAKAIPGRMAAQFIDYRAVDHGEILPHLFGYDGVVRDLHPSIVVKAGFLGDVLPLPFD
jgi:hypothetical protein